MKALIWLEDFVKHSQQKQMSQERAVTISELTDFG